jgi:hypothetical protein
MCASHLFGEPSLSLLAADGQRESLAVLSHGRQHTPGLICAVIRAAQCDEERSAIQREESSSEAVLVLDDVGDESQGEDQSVHLQTKQ